MPKVLNCRDGDRSSHKAVYVGRPSKWGNPFAIGRDGTREQVIELYSQKLKESPVMADIGELKGKDLLCWCAPLPCHADVLLALANKED